jgi:hypothetical protein
VSARRYDRRLEAVKELVHRRKTTSESGSDTEEIAVLARIHTYGSHRQAGRSELPVVRRRRLALERV